MRAPETSAHATLIPGVEAAVREAGALAASTFQTALKTWTKQGAAEGRTDSGVPVGDADVEEDRRNAAE